MEAIKEEWANPENHLPLTHSSLEASVSYLLYKGSNDNYYQILTLLVLFLFQNF